MTDYTPDPTAYPPRETVVDRALRLAQNPNMSRLLAMMLTQYTTTADLWFVVRRLELSMGRTDLRMHEHVSQLAELEAERARFLDPNRPGE